MDTARRQRIASKYENLIRYYYYMFYGLFKVPVPKPLARAVAFFNRRDAKKDGIPRVYFQTYDGSSQAVHPDVTVWRDKYWMVLSPYPYSVDAYENPCVYFGDSIFSMSGIRGNPLSYSKIKKLGNFLSDPFLFADGERLYVFYRDSIYTDGSNSKTIYCRSSADGAGWTPAEKVVASVEDSLISPAIIRSGGEYYFYHVRLTTECGGDILLSRGKTPTDWNFDRVLRCVGIPENMTIWHIAVAAADGYDKYDPKPIADKAGGLVGLFMLRTLENAGPNKIFWARAERPDADWVLEEELNIPSNIRENSKSVYKSAILPDTGDVLLSIQDKRDRWSFCVVPGDRGRTRPAAR